jgi:hypothetical protein
MSGRTTFWLSLLLTVFVLGVQANSAFAVNRHVFDPTLSLAGNCGESTVDPVPDPGCPGGNHPPKGAFDSPCGVATDRHGYIYVASGAQSVPAGTGGRIDVFNAQGEFLVDIPSEFQPCNLAVDSVGNLYVGEYRGKRASLYKPSSFPPVASTTYTRSVIYDPADHGNPAGELCLNVRSVAVDPSDDHLYIGHDCLVEEYGSAAEGSPLVDADIEPDVEGLSLQAIDVYASTGQIYASASPSLSEDERPSRILVFDPADGNVDLEIDGSATPSESFEGTLGLGIAVDQSSGDVYVDDTAVHRVVDQFSAGGTFIGQLPKPPIPTQPQPFAGMAIDAPYPGQVGYDSPNESYVYTGSGTNSSASRLFAYAPASVAGPEVRNQTASAITETEAILGAEINPGALDTRYHIEYTTEALFLEAGYTGAVVVPVPDQSAGAGGSFVSVAKAVTGLQPGTAYRFRVVATNEECVTTGEGNSEASSESCEEGPDATFRTYDIETGLPDQRAYELVSPSNMNGRIPTMSELAVFGESNFPTNFISTDGEGVAFGTQGGSLPGSEGGGFNDVYEARRQSGGVWQTEFAGVPGPLASEVYIGGISDDHGGSFWRTVNEKGTLPDGSYVRWTGRAVESRCSPDPASGLEYIGCGSLANATLASGKWISPGGGHLIFTVEDGAPPLEAAAPPAGTDAIYDRTANGVTHVVSLLPSDVTPAAGASAAYEGSSNDGSSVAFTVQGTMYVRADNAATKGVGTGDLRFAGFSADGDRLVYLRPDAGEPTLSGTEIPQGKIFTFDVNAGTSSEVAAGSKAILVNVSADGSSIYFVSPQQLDGETGVPGGSNLYLARGSSIQFIATLDEKDVKGAVIETVRSDGLGLWITHAVSGSFGRRTGLGADPSRSTEDGLVLVFQSRAQLTSYDNGGHTEIYRYSTEDGLTCVSCNPTGVDAVSDARLQSNASTSLVSQPPVTALSRIPNLTSDGLAVVFETADRLAPRDSDGKADVYKWNAAGSSGCVRLEGCVHLISSGQSGGDDYLYAMTADGEDIVFLSGDRLVPQDADGTPSLYDARAPHLAGEAVGAPPVPPVTPPCIGEACQPPATIPPADADPVSSRFHGPGNVSAKPRPCRKGKRRAAAAKAKRHCVRHHGKRHVRRTHRGERSTR